MATDIQQLIGEETAAREKLIDLLANRWKPGDKAVALQAQDLLGKVLMFAVRIAEAQTEAERGGGAPRA